MRANKTNLVCNLGLVKFHLNQGMNAVSTTI